jgi:serine/threonine protein kinase
VIGKTVSHYKILEKLAEGGMGVVYKADDTKLDRKVALKFLPKEFTKDHQAKERFKREAKAAAALNHPNIVTIYEINEHEGQTYIAMEYVEGETLKELIVKNSKLKIDGRGEVTSPFHMTKKKGKETLHLQLGQILNIITQICEGLSAAHAKGIIHRDIKPPNIIINKDGQIKILDFGLAKLKGVSQLTKEQSTLGTIHYMSPEQALGKEVDHRTDIWSLGIVLYEIISGQLPFKGDYQQVVVYSILNEEPEPVTGLRTGMPMELERILNKALTKNPDERYQRVQEIKIDLKNLRKKLELRILKGKPIDTGSQPSIAVLPFRDMSPEKDQDYFCEGIAEEIMNSLNQIERLRVIARTSAFAYKGKNVDAREIGKRLDVKTLLEGSIRKAGNRLRITAQLINVADGSHLWSERYDREMEDIFAIQDEITLTVVANLKIKLLGKEKENLVKRHTDNQEAHHSYLRGRYFWNRRHKIGYQMALEHFQLALEKDPLFALPYVGIADTYNLLGYFGIIPPDESFPKAKAAAERAIEIDDSLGEPHTSLGWTSTWYEWNWQKAERKFKQALELNPTYATGHSWYSLYLICMARFDEAITETKKAIELDPLSTIINASTGCLYFFAQQYDESIIYFQKTMELDPSFMITYAWLGSSYAILGRRDEALAILRKGRTMAGDMPYALGFIGQGFAMAGLDDEAQSILDQLNQLSQKNYVPPFYKMMINSGLGNMDEAFKHLDKSYAGRDSLLAMSKTMPQMDRLRSDPRFTKYLGKMGLDK